MADLQFYFAAQSVRDREEWVTCLRQYTNPVVLQNVSHHDRSYSDAASVYSAYTYRSTASRASRRSYSTVTSNHSRRRATMSEANFQAPAEEIAVMSMDGIEPLVRPC
jgi:hypothetical protein